MHLMIDGTLQFSPQLYAIVLYATWRPRRNWCSSARIPVTCDGLTCQRGKQYLHRMILPAMTSLLDQSALSDLAERLVAAARRAGADAADAVAVRSVSI